MAASVPHPVGVITVARGSVASRLALRAAEAVLQQDGVLGIYPEAGAWSRILRPPRPGTAFIAVRSGARLLPVGVDGVPNIFRALLKGKRARVTVRIGQPFGPYQVSGSGRERRQQLEDVGHDIMRHIAALLPAESRGYYATTRPCASALWPRPSTDARSTAELRQALP